MGHLVIRWPGIQDLRTRIPETGNQGGLITLILINTVGVRMQARETRGLRRNEPVSAIYSAAGRDVADDVWRPAGRDSRLPAAARVCLARGGLSDNSGDDVLSRRRSDGDGVVGHSAA